MTAAGIALIAGGLATLICFRSVLFGRGSRRAGRNTRTAEAADIQPKPRGTRGSRRRGRAPEPLIPPAEENPRGALASIGLAEEGEEPFSYEDDPRAASAEPERVLASFAPEPADLASEPIDFVREPVDFVPEPVDFVREPADLLPEPVDFASEPVDFASEPVDFVPEPVDHGPEPGELVGLELVPDLELDPAPGFDDLDDDEPDYPGERYGHRIQGWVRPEYRHVPEEPPSGEYWTPIPVDLDPDPEPSAKGYGWPSPVERLPSVPDYEPATGFDLAPVEHEPTEVVSARSDEQRFGLPRSWSARNDKRAGRAEKQESRSDRRERREWRTENEALPTTQLFAAVSDDQPPARRRRPRPRPRPSVEPPDRSTRVYVSRHAAEPPPR
jgi:hypothetical protein